MLTLAFSGGEPLLRCDVFALIERAVQRDLVVNIATNGGIITERLASRLATSGVGTREGTGFDVAGSHVFTFRKGKIRSLRVTISPKPMKSLNTKLALSDFSVQDVGRLSLAAWAVV